MEATNISIKKASSVSINIEKLQAIKQRVWSAVANFSLFTLHFSLSRLYRKELRLARAIARMIDAHPTISNIWIGGWTIAGIYFIFMYA